MANVTTTTAAAAAAVDARNYLITGAGRGIGRGLSRLLLQKGHRVFLIDHNGDELAHTASRLGQTHRRGLDFEAVECNVRDPRAIASVAQQASRFFDAELHCLINNAAYTGGVGGQHLSNLTLDDWNSSVETNLTGPMLMSQACLPMLKKAAARARTTVASGGGGGGGGGSSSIVHMSSTRAFMSERNNEPYAATKAALLGLSQSMAVSLAPDGVRCNAVLPGWINVTDECKKADEAGRTWEEGLSKDDHAWHLTGRVGRVEDVFRAVEYLASADFVTGEELVVDGGVTRKMIYPEEDDEEESTERGYAMEW